MASTSGLPVGAHVRERLREAQRAEACAIAAVQKALAAEADVRARLDAMILKHRAELSKAERAVQTAQAAVVRTSGLERAAALLDVSPKMLKSALKETAECQEDQEDASLHAMRSKTPAATTAPTTAPTMT